MIMILVHDTDTGNDNDSDEDTYNDYGHDKANTNASEIMLMIKNK